GSLVPPAPVRSSCVLRLQLLAHTLQQPPGGVDPLRLRKVAALVFYADPPSITRIENDAHHASVIDLHLVALGVEVVRLGADAFCKRDELLHALILVVTMVLADTEVAEVRKGASSRVIPLLHDRREPLPIPGKAAVVLHDHIHLLTG